MEENNELSMYKSYVGVRFNNGARAYFFGVKHEDNIELNDYVVVETIRGLELGQVVISPVDITNYNSDFGLKPVIRKASDVDLRIHQNNLKDAQIAMEICQAEVKRLGLDMNLI